MRAPVLTASVLVVDAVAPDLARIDALLQALGCRVTVVAGIREALALAPALQPDVVMLPLSGAPIDGYEACRRLHGGTTTRHSQVVLVADDGTVVDHVWAKLQGARTVLCKPYTSDKVQEMLHACARFR